MRQRKRRTLKWARRLRKRLDVLFLALERNLGNPRWRQRKSRLREAVKLMQVLQNHRDRLAAGYRQKLAAGTPAD